MSDHSQNYNDETSSPKQAMLRTAQDAGLKQVLCYTSTAVEKGISGWIDDNSFSESTASSAIISAAKTTEDEELLDKLLQSEGVLILGQQDKNGAGIPRVRHIVS
jgi:hypothetical protein